MINKIKAFTMAELLITLGIIGIVAEITIPTLISKMQKEQYVQGLKTSYSETQQFFKQYAMNEGVNSLPETHLFNTNGDVNYDNLDAEINKYFKTSISCKPGVASCDIWYTIKYLATNGSLPFGNPGYSFCMVNGICVTMRLNDLCQQSSIFAYNTEDYGNRCGNVIVDVNGKKPPNKYGRDSFGFALGDDGVLYPFGSLNYAKKYLGGGSSYYWKNNTNYCGTLTGSMGYYTSGSGCAARIIDEGWEMKY